MPFPSRGGGQRPSVLDAARIVLFGRPHPAPPATQTAAAADFAIAQSAALLRCATVIFPVLLLIRNWHGFFLHDDLVVAGVALMAAQCWLVFGLVRRFQALVRNRWVGADLILSGLVLVCYVRSAPPAVLASGLDGLLPYLQAATCPLAAAYVLSPYGIAGLGVLEALWVYAMSAGMRRPSPAGDLAGFVFWYGVFAAVTVTFQQLAARADTMHGDLARSQEALRLAQFSHAHTIKNVRRTIADLRARPDAESRPGLLRMDQALRLAEEDLTAGDDRGRQLRECIGRGETFAGARGLTLGYEDAKDTDVIILGEPPPEIVALVDSTLRALTLNLVHAGTDTAYLRILASSSYLNLQFSDRGAGFDVAAAQWSEATGRWRAQLREAGATVEIDSAPGAGTRWTIGWQDRTAP